MAKTGTQWLTHEEIEQVINGLSADDLIEGTSAKGQDAGGTMMLKVAFNRAAIRAGHGEDAMTRVMASDFQFLARRLGEVINVDSPLSPDTGALLDSATSGQ